MFGAALRRFALCAVLLLAAGAGARAASISWSDAQGIAGDSDVSTVGELVYAVNLGGRVDGKPVNVTLNGVTFAGAVTDGLAGVFSWSVSRGKSGWSNNAYAPSYHRLGPVDGLAAGYRTLLQSGIRADNTGGGAGVATLTLRGLTVGRHYQVQIWSNDSGWNENAYARAASVTSGAETISSAGNTVHLDANTSDSGGGGLGQFVLGSFVATSATQDIVLASLTDGDGAGILVNAFQLRDVGGIRQRGSRP